MELYFALQSDIPIVAVTLVGRGYEEADTLNLFTEISEQRSNAGVPKQLLR
jgi:hypothetical protein